MSLLIKSLEQQDNFTFAIVWSDGVKSCYRLSQLQEKCPCAKCSDLATGQQRSFKEKPDPQVRAVRIQSAGQYALRIQFTSGCSAGIYSYAFLRKLSQASS